MAPASKIPSKRPSSGDVAAFLKKAASTPVLAPDGKNGRLVFAMDATASRGPSWAQAMAIQTDMFQEAAGVGGLDVQLVYYRGLMDFGGMTSQTLLGFASPAGHDHDDNCLVREYRCIRCGDRLRVSKRRSCPACGWEGRDDCWCHPDPKLDKWPEE